MENIVLTEKLLEEYGFWKEVDTSYRKTYMCDKNVYIGFLYSYKSINIMLLKPKSNPEDFSTVLKKVCIYNKTLLLSDLQNAFDFFKLKLEKPIEFWIARDNNNNLYLYSEKPIICRLTKNYYTEDIHKSFRINNNLFPNITYKDRPKKVLLKLID